MPVHAQIRVPINQIELTVHPDDTSHSYPIEGEGLVTSIAAAAQAFSRVAAALARFVEAEWDLEGYEDGWQREAVLSRNFQDIAAAEKDIQAITGVDFYLVARVSEVLIDGDWVGVEPPEEAVPPGPPPAPPAPTLPF